MPATWGYAAKDIKSIIATWGFATSIAGSLAELDILVQTLDDRYGVEVLSDRYRATLLEDRYKVDDSGD